MLSEVEWIAAAAMFQYLFVNNNILDAPKMDSRPKWTPSFGISSVESRNSFID